MNAGWPERFERIAGDLPEGGKLAAADVVPYDTVEPASQGFVDRDGVRIWYAVWGSGGPFLAFAPPFQIVHAEMLKGVVPWLSQHFRVVTMDPRGNGHSDRPAGQKHYSLDLYVGDFQAVLDAAGADRVALVGISAAAMTVLRTAAELPARVTHVITAGGFAQSMVSDAALAARIEAEFAFMAQDWPGYVDGFMQKIFNEPHSTKPYEDGVRFGWATSAEVLSWCYRGWLNNDVRDHARRVRCPTLRMVMVAGPRLSAADFPQMDGLEVRPYVHKLFEHLACSDLALVQGGLSTTMELVATRRPFLSFPLRNHFEQCVHVRRRLFNYEADNSVDYAETDATTLARRALAQMHAPVRYRPVETDGAVRAAQRIAEVLENRHWAC